MDKLKRQVAIARRRMIAQQFLGLLPWCWFGALVLAAAAIGVQKWFLPAIDGWRWAVAWLGGGIALGLMAAMIGTWNSRRGELDAALEIDRRFGLKERLSSSLALTREELHSPCGQALVDDAALRISRLDVARRFPVTLSRRLLVPIVPAAIAIVLYWVAAPVGFIQASSDSDRAAAARQVQEAIKPLEKQVQRRAEQAKENGLIPVAELLQRIAEKIQNLVNKDKADRHEALAELHDLTQELAHYREQLAEQTKIKQYLAAMENVPSGPAEKLAQELKYGNFENALAELKKLQEQLPHGQLDAQRQLELAQQMAAMSKSLHDFLEQHSQIREKLREQIAQAKQTGDQQAVKKLQEQLSRLDKQLPMMEATKEFSDQLAQVGKGSQSHNMAQTKAALDQLAALLGQLQQQNEGMELIEATLNDIDGAKIAMNGKQGGTEGTANYPDRSGGTEGIGHREGGTGVLPERVQANTYDSKVKSQPSGRGGEISAGPADGPNVKGKAIEKIKVQLQAARTESANPIINLTLPRAQREQVQQYFDAFRGGQ